MTPRKLLEQVHALLNHESINRLHDGHHETTSAGWIWWMGERQRVLKLVTLELAAPRDPEDEDPAATVRSIAAMLGWENVPPRRILEMEIAAMKARIKSACGAASHDPITCLKYDDRNEDCTCGFVG